MVPFFPLILVFLIKLELIEFKKQPAAAVQIGRRLRGAAPNFRI